MTDALPSGYQPLLHARYGGAGIGAALRDNAIVAALLRHRSVRGYLPAKLPAGTIETLVAAAQSAPTSSNLQTWSVVAVEDEARRARLSALAQNQAFIREAPLFLAWIADLSRLDRVGQARGQHLEGLDYLEMFMVAAIDAALAAQNAVVAAQSIGLRTVYIGAMRNDPIRVAKLLDLPHQSFVVFGLCVGYATEKGDGEVKPRLPQSTVLHHERYNAANEAAQRKVYDAEMSRFSARHELQAATWTQRVLNRLAPLKSMNGRETIRASLAKLGFEIR